MFLYFKYTWFVWMIVVNSTVDVYSISIMFPAFGLVCLPLHLLLKVICPCAR